MEEKAVQTLTREEADAEVKQAEVYTQMEVNISDGSQIEVRCSCFVRKNEAGKPEKPYMRLYTASNLQEYIICRWFFDGGCKTVIRTAVMDEVTPMEDSFHPGLICEECEKEGICEAAWCGKKIYCGFCDSEEYFNGNEDDWCRCGEHPSTSRR